MMSYAPMGAHLGVLMRHFAFKCVYCALRGPRNIPGTVKSSVGAEPLFWTLTLENLISWTQGVIIATLVQYRDDSFQGISGFQGIVKFEEEIDRKKGLRINIRPLQSGLKNAIPWKYWYLERPSH